MKLFNTGLKRCIIAVKQGTYRGEFLVEMDRTQDQTTFLSLPDKYIRKVTNVDVERGLKEKVLEIVDKLPRCVYTVCKKEYELILGEQAGIHSHNRR